MLSLIGWIGAGRMGVPMAGFILRAGYDLRVYSRSAASRHKLVSQGAREAASAAECARGADVVFSCLPDDAGLRQVALGPEGVLANAKPGAIFADTSTVSPEVCAQVQREAAARDIAYLRMPISGNAKQAQTGDLAVFVSGPEAAWKSVERIVAAFSRAQVYLGGENEAIYMKLVTNSLVVNTAQVMAEALALGRKAGLDWILMLDTLAQSAIASPWLKAKIGLLKQRDFDPTMTTRLILKDLDLMLSAARENQVPMPITALTRQMMQSVIGAGYGEEDYMATVKLAEKQSGLSPDEMD
jgi:3-hydroxyisobutyrate dehydrogenase-like beta-hydroxyacid dehydrogenase